MIHLRDLLFWQNLTNWANLPYQFELRKNSNTEVYIIFGNNVSSNQRICDFMRLKNILTQKENLQFPKSILGFLPYDCGWIIVLDAIVLKERHACIHTHNRAPDIRTHTHIQSNTRCPQTDRQTDRQTDIHTQTHAAPDTERERERKKVNKNKKDRKMV